MEIEVIKIFLSLNLFQGSEKLFLLEETPEREHFTVFSPHQHKAVSEVRHNLLLFDELPVAAFSLDHFKESL